MTKSMNAEQLALWYDSYGDRLMLYARNWLPEDAARDAVQCAFVRLMGLILPPRDAQAWLYRTVRNEAITRLRRQERQRRHSRKIATERISWFETRPEDLIDARTAQEVLMTLPEAQREVVLLRIWGQLSLKQTARIVGTSLTTVHSRYKAALAAIKKRMQQSCKTTTD